MFRVGQKVKCIGIPKPEHFQLKDGKNCVGQIYIIKSIHDKYKTLMFKTEYGAYGWELFVACNDINKVSEVELLDMIQNNFRE